MLSPSAMPSDPAIPWRRTISWNSSRKIEIGATATTCSFTLSRMKGPRIENTSLGVIRMRYWTAAARMSSAAESASPVIAHGSNLVLLGNW